MMKPLVTALSVLALAACGVDFQTTSGATYLAATNIDDPALRQAAAYEPRLRFPARIGVIRLVYNKVSNAPAGEQAVFAPVLAAFPGEVVQLGALEARMAEGGNGGYPDQAGIRRLAASRHLDYVLIIAYDIGQNTAEALFLDVRSGYPYASAEATGPGRGQSNFWGGPLQNQSRINAATLRLSRALAPELEAMLRGLLARAGTR